MSETRQDDPWATVRTFAQTRTGLWPSDSGRWYCRTEVDAARAAEATQHQQEIAALEAMLATAQQTAMLNERAYLTEHDRLAAVEAERDRLKAALSQATQDLETVGNDYPGSSCWQWCTERADASRAALSGEGTKP